MEDYVHWASTHGGGLKPPGAQGKLDLRQFAPFSAASPTVGQPSRIETGGGGGAPLLQLQPDSPELIQPSNMAGLYMPDARASGQPIPPFPTQFPLSVPLPPHIHAGAYHHGLPPLQVKPSTWQVPPPPEHHLNPAANAEQQQAAKGPPANKCLTLGPPTGRTTSYSIPLPNDCEGLIFALEGKFKVGDEIVSDAATAILSVLTDKFDKVSAAYIEGLGKPKLKAQITKSLESSWITSSLLGERLITVALQLKQSIEGVIASERSPHSPPNEVCVASLEKLNKRPFQVEAFVSVVESIEKWVGIRHSLGVLEKYKQAKVEAPVEQPPRAIVTINPNPEPRGVGRPRARRVPSIGEFVDSLDPASQIPMPKPPARHDILGSIALALPPLVDLWRSAMLCGEVELQTIFSGKAEKMNSENTVPSSSSSVTSVNKKSQEDRPLVNLMGESALLTRELDGAASRKADKLFADTELMDLFLESVKEVEFLQWKEQRRQSQCEDMSELESNQSSPMGKGLLEERDRPPRDGDAIDKDSSTLFLDRANLETLLHGEQHERTKHLARIERELQWSVAKDIGLKYPFLVSVNRIMIAILRLASYLGPIGYKDLILHLTRTTAAAWDQLRAVDVHNDECIHCPRVFKQIGTSYLESLMHFAWEQGIIVSEPLKDPSFFAMSYQVAMFTIRSFARFVTVSLFPSVATRTAKTFQFITSDHKDEHIPIDLPLARAAILVILVGLDELTSINKLPELTGIDLKSFVISLLYCTFGASVVYGRIKGYVSDADAVHLAEKREEVLADSQTMRGLIENLPGHLQERVAHLIKEKKPMLEILHPLESFSPELKPGTSAARRLSGDNVNASVIPGSYTIPLTQTPPERDLIDSTKERSTSYGTELYGPIFEDIIYTCSATLANIAQDAESRALLKQSETILEEISVLSRSTQIAQLCRCISRDEPLTSIPTDDTDNEMETETMAV